MDIEKVRLSFNDFHQGLKKQKEELQAIVLGVHSEKSISPSQYEYFKGAFKVLNDVEPQVLQFFINVLSLLKNEEEQENDSNE